MRTTPITFASSPPPSPQTTPTKPNQNLPKSPPQSSRMVMSVTTFAFIFTGFMLDLYFKVNASSLKQTLAKLESPDEANELYRKSLIRYPGDGNIVAIVLENVPKIKEEPVKLKILAQILGLEDWNDDLELLATALKSIQSDPLRESAETFLENYTSEAYQSPNQIRVAQLVLIDKLNTEAYKPLD